MSSERSLDPGRASPGQSIVRRHMDASHGAIFALADFASLFQAYTDHVRLWGIEPDPLARVMMHQALGGAALYLSSRPPDEFVAWTLNIHDPPLNLFFTGSGDTQSVTGRAFSVGIETVGVSRLYVDSQRAGGEHVRSTIEVTGLDVLQIFEQYSRESEQNRARYFELTDEKYLMVQSLPAEDTQWLDGLDRAAAREALSARDRLRQLDERVFWFQCGCDPEKMVATIRALYASRLEADLFKGEPAVEVSCPRCGRHWTLGRDSFA